MSGEQPEFQTGVALSERAREYLGWYPTADVDVLVVGGGVQGLTLVDELTDRGYATALVSSAPLGAGQTFDHPGVLSKGYLDPDADRRRAIDEWWLPRAEGLQAPVAGGEWYVLSSEFPYRHLRDQWDEAGYDYEERDVETVPEVLREGSVFDTGEKNVAAVDEYTIDREALVRALAEGHEDRIVVGDIEGVSFEGIGEAPALDRLTVETRKDLTVEFDPEYVVAATGTGTHGFVDSVVGSDGFDGDADRVRESVSSVTYRNVPVLAVRGPATELPAVSAYMPSKGATVVARRHRHRGENYVTWYVTTDASTAEVDPEDATDDATGTLDPAKVEAGFDKLFELAPAVKERASDDERDGPGPAAEGDIEFYAYATLAQEVDGAETPHLATPLDGLANVGVALPSSAAGVPAATDDAVGYVADAVEPTGALDSVPSSYDPPVGELADDRPGARWLDWDALGRRYPRIHERPNAAGR